MNISPIPAQVVADMEKFEKEIEKLKKEIKELKSEVSWLRMREVKSPL
jgi:cell division septum initiation protein DivIVA